MSRATYSSKDSWGPRIAGPLLAWALMAGILAGPARAGTYTVESCTSAAQPGIAGWVALTLGQYTYADAYCATGNSFQGYFNDGVPHAGGDYAVYTFTAPANLTVSSLAAWRTAQAGPYRDYGNAVAMLQADGAILEECQRYFGCTSLTDGPISFGLTGARSLSFGAYCAGSAGCPPGQTAYRLRRVVLGLTDIDDPVFTVQPTGSLTSNAPNLPAMRNLTYSATDQGGGVYRHRLFVDGKVVVTGTVNVNGGRCVEPFRDPVPCRTSPTNASIDFDTGTLAAGQHTVRLEVSDATDENKVLTAPWAITVGPGAEFPGATAGGLTSTTTTTNTTTLYDARDLNTVAFLRNPVSARIANGSPAAADALLVARLLTGSGSRARTSTRLVAPYGRRVTVRGTLQTPGGRPIAAARVFLVQKPIGASERAWRIGKDATTGSDGGFSMPVDTRDRSRDLRVVYFPMGGSDANRGSNPLTLQVRQDADFAVSRRRLRNGAKIVFRGRVRGTIPTGGVDVRVQVRLNRSWFTFAKLRATRRRGGRFQAAHRFTKTTRATTYRFRILVLPRTRTTYSTGFSRPIDVRVLP